MFWKLAVSALVLPACLGFGTISAQAASSLKHDSDLPQAQSSVVSEPEYYANNYYEKRNCYRTRRHHSSHGSYYRPQSYHRSYYRPKYYHRSNYYHGGHKHGHGNHRHGYHNNYNNGYRHNGYGH
jgi:hypothetical protein